ncbi:hypothetical protein LINGRAHAP2_LOCUS4396 [Linum grandiflorum]
MIISLPAPITLLMRRKRSGKRWECLRIIGVIWIYHGLVFDISRSFVVMNIYNIYSLLIYVINFLNW